MGRPSSGYRVGGEKVPGTTTITGRFMESGGLVWWAFRQGQQDPDASSPYAARDEAAKVGTIVHEMVEAHLRGEDPESVEAREGASGEVLEQADTAFGGFLDWWQMQSVEPVLMEVPLTSTTHRFGGTPDLWARTPHGLELWDWKSSKSLYTGHLLQAAAYRHLHDVNRGGQGQDGTDIPDEPVVASNIVVFKKDTGDFAHKRFRDLSEEWEQFAALRRCYDRDKSISKRAG